MFSRRWQRHKIAAIGKGKQLAGPAKVAAIHQNKLAKDRSTVLQAFHKDIVRMKGFNQHHPTIQQHGAVVQDANLRHADLIVDVEEVAGKAVGFHGPQRWRVKPLFFLAIVTLCASPFLW